MAPRHFFLLGLLFTEVFGVAGFSSAAHGALHQLLTVADFAASSCSR
jgi:hypothetical protein